MQPIIKMSQLAQGWFKIKRELSNALNRYALLDFRHRKNKCSCYRNAAAHTRNHQEKTTDKRKVPFFPLYLHSTPSKTQEKRNWPSVIFQTKCNSTWSWRTHIPALHCECPLLTPQLARPSLPASLHAPEWCLHAHIPLPPGEFLFTFTHNH